jgi:hypothetical protein
MMFEKLPKQSIPAKPVQVYLIVLQTISTIWVVLYGVELMLRTATIDRGNWRDAAVLCAPDTLSSVQLSCCCYLRDW